MGGLIYTHDPVAACDPRVHPINNCISSPSDNAYSSLRLMFLLSMPEHVSAPHRPSAVYVLYVPGSQIYFCHHVHARKPTPSYNCPCIV
jgi:hypothetical protein